MWGKIFGRTGCGRHEKQGGREWRHEPQQNAMFRTEVKLVVRNLCRCRAGDTRRTACCWSNRLVMLPRTTPRLPRRVVFQRALEGHDRVEVHHRWGKLRRKVQCLGVVQGARSPSGAVFPGDPGVNRLVATSATGQKVGALRQTSTAQAHDDIKRFRLLRRARRFRAVLKWWRTLRTLRLAGQWARSQQRQCFNLRHQTALFTILFSSTF